MPAARLLIGPLLRRVVGTRATVWVETSAPAVVTVRAAGGASGTAPTFSAYDHHYALVVVDGTDPGQRGELRGADRRRGGLAGAGERLPRPA